MFKSCFGVSLALFATESLATPSAEQRATVPEWDALATTHQFDYDMYTVETQDEWNLTLFRITGRTGQTQPTASTKPPLLIQCGMKQDAATWLSTQNAENDPFVLQLLDRGYDVWMGNQRGTRYSLVNPKFPDAENPDSPSYAAQNFAKYDFSWNEMGLYDQPANIDKIIEVTGKENVTFIAFSQGTTLMFAGLAQIEDTYYAEKLNKAVMLAPGFFADPMGQEAYAQIFPAIRAAGVNTMFGPDVSAKNAKICSEAGEGSRACRFAKIRNRPGGQVTPLKSFEYFQQVSISERFQEYNADFATAESLESTLITPGIDSINKVPIQFLMAKSDTIMKISYAEELRERLTTLESFDFLPDESYDHVVFESINNEEYIDELVRQIELVPTKVPAGNTGGNGDANDDGAQRTLVFSAATILISAISIF